MPALHQKLAGVDDVQSVYISHLSHSTDLPDYISALVCY